MNHPYFFNRVDKIFKIKILKIILCFIAEKIIILAICRAIKIIRPTIFQINNIHLILLRDLSQLRNRMYRIFMDKI